MAEKKLNHLRFADDLILLSNDPKSLQAMLEQLIYESNKVGLFMNATKTKLMMKQNKVPITVTNTIIGYVNEYTYIS